MVNAKSSFYLAAYRAKLFFGTILKAGNFHFEQSLDNFPLLLFFAQNSIQLLDSFELLPHLSADKAGILAATIKLPELMLYITLFLIWLLILVTIIGVSTLNLCV